MSSTPKNGFGLVIKTSEYTGNFEREMCAYLTGQIGECEVGSEFVDVLEDKPSFDDIKHVNDDHGCARPVSLDESNANNLVIFFDKKPSKKQIDWIKEHAASFDKVHKTIGHSAKYNVKSPVIKIKGFALIEYKSSKKETKL